MLFIPLTKVDAAQRLVYGRIDETPDRAAEIFDYAGSKPHFEKWSAELHKASGGKSLGNVRAMHGPVSAGVLTAIEFNDAAKAIEFCAHVVDDDSWRKVEAGAYTGFSPGGRYLKRWKDGDNHRYIAAPAEISLVDLPCIPSATFTMVKADGLSVETPFEAAITPAELTALTEAMAKAATPSDLAAILLPQPSRVVALLYPDEAARQAAEVLGLAKRDWSADERKEAADKGEAMPDGSYPIKTKDDLEKAVEAYGRAKDKPEVKAHIVARAKALDATDMLPADWDGSTKKADKAVPIAALQKGMESVACLARILADIRWLQQSAEFESALEGDASALPAAIKAWLASGADLLVQAVGEEAAEMKAGENADLAMAASIAGFAKMAGDLAGARVALAGKDAELTKINGERDVLQKRVAELEAKPADGGPRLRAVEKGTEIAANANANDDQALDAELQRIAELPAGDEKSLALIKLATRHPVRITTPAIAQ